MRNKKSVSTTLFYAVCLAGSLISQAVYATVVEVRTNQGNFQINLFDNDTPLSTDNFLSYVNAGAYANNTVHRSVPNFVIQMGGFQYNNSFPPDAIATGTPVVNEPVLSNVRGTVAMAKLGGNANSATSQFFVNLSNNSSNLDVSNGGFTVFGQVIGDGMEVVDQIAALQRFNFGGAFAELPLDNYTASNASNNTPPNDNNLVIISDIVVVDDAVTTNPSITPVRNTLINSGGNNAGQPSADSGGSGGSVSILCLLYLSLIATSRRLKKQ